MLIRRNDTLQINVQSSCLKSSHLKKFLKILHVVFSVFINRISKNTTLIWYLVHHCYLWKEIFLFYQFQQKWWGLWNIATKKKIKNFIAMPKNFLMIADITSIAALSCAIYVLFGGIAIIFRLHLVFWAAASRKNVLGFRDLKIFRDHIFNAVPKKLQIFIGLYNWKIRLNLKFKWNMMPIC